jgi:hypothetical protein
MIHFQNPARVIRLVIRAFTNIGVIIILCTVAIENYQHYYKGTVLLFPTLHVVTNYLILILKSLETSIWERPHEKGNFVHVQI